MFPYCAVVLTIINNKSVYLNQTCNRHTPRKKPRKISYRFTKPKAMKYFGTFLVIVIVFAFCRWSSCLPVSCPEKEEGELNQTCPLNDLDFADIGRRFYTRCCMKGYDNITWYLNDTNLKKWTPTELIQTNQDYFFSFWNDSQIFGIFSVQYVGLQIKCVARNFTSNKKKQHVVSVQVSEDEKAPKMKLIHPYSSTLEIADFPKKVTIKCSLEVGKDAFKPNFGWCVPDNLCYGGCMWNDSGKPCSRLEGNIVDSEGVYTHELTIYNITNSDIGTTVRCSFGTRPVYKDGKTIAFWNVTITDARGHRQRTKDNRIFTFAVCIPLLILIFLVIIVIVLVKTFRLTSKIRLFARSFFSESPQRRSFELCESDFGIIHTQDENAVHFATCLRNDLQQFNFSVSLLEDFSNKTNGQGISDLVNTCKALLIIPHGMDFPKLEPHISGIKKITLDMNLTKRKIAVVKFNKCDIPIDLKSFTIIQYIARDDKKYKRADFKRQFQLMLPAIKL